MSEKTIFTTNLGEGKPMLTIHVDPQFICLDENEGAPMKFRFKHMPTAVWGLMVLFAVMAVGAVVAGRWLAPVFPDKTTLFASFPGTVKAMSSTNAWSRTVIVVALLAAVVTLFWIGCKYSVRMAKLAYEEWNQRFAMRRFLFEKTVEYAERSAKKDKSDGNDSKWSISITVNKNAENGKNDNPSDDPKEPKPDNDNPPPKPAGGPSPDILPSNSGTSEPAVNRTEAVPDETIGTHLMCNGGVFDSGYAEPTTSAGKG